MTDKEFLEEKIRQTKMMLSLIVNKYDGDDKQEIIDMLLDSINDSNRRLEQI